jgi:hypothetical protein
MKKLLPFLLFVFGCGLLPDHVAEFEKLTPPILLVAKSKEGTVTVCDSSNRYVTIGSGYYLSLSLSASYEVGDTILFFHRR